jgi:predicted CopG family antitoxin
MSSTKLRQIVIDDNNYNKLKRLGHAGDSFNDVLTQVLQNMKNEKREVVSKD